MTNPPAKVQIPFNRAAIVGNEKLYVGQAIDSGYLAGKGPFGNRCHEWLEKHLGCKKAFLTHSGTGALEMAAILCGIGPGDEVIMPSFTFVSTASAFVLRGSVPIFVDIRKDTLNIDEKLIQRAITPRTKAIVVIHYAGVPCDMDAISAIARHHGLLVVEDAAQALLSGWRGCMAGSIGQLGCLSFHETKNVTSGEGGALLVNDEKMVERAEIIYEKGTDRMRFIRGEIDKYTWVDVGSSYLAGELMAAHLFAQLEHAEAITTRRRAIHARYLEGLRSLELNGSATLPVDLDGVTHNGHNFYLILPDHATRERLIRHLKAQGIQAVFHYVPLHSSPAGKRYGRTDGELRVTDTISDCLVRLPLHTALADEAVDHVIEAVRGFFT